MELRFVKYNRTLGSFYFTAEVQSSQRFLSADYADYTDFYEDGLF